MKLFYRRLILLFAFLLTPFAFGKYKTAMIFSGGGMQIPMFIGMLDGLEEKGVEAGGKGLAVMMGGQVELEPNHMSSDRRAPWLGGGGSQGGEERWGGGRMESLVDGASGD